MTKQIDINALYAIMRERIRALGRRGITYKDIAHESGVTVRWLVSFMNGGCRHPSGDNILRTCGVIGITVTYKAGKVLPVFKR